MSFTKTKWDRRAVPQPTDPPKKRSWISKLGSLFIRNSSSATEDEDKWTPLPSRKQSHDPYGRENNKEEDESMSLRDDSNTSIATSAAFSASMADDTTVNDFLRSELPELAVSKEGYYEYPLSGTHWLEPTQKVMGQPAYIAKREKPKKDEIVPIQKNYAFGYGRYGYGHYHLMTVDAWKALHKGYKGKNAQVRKLLKKRARSKYRNDTNPNQIKFSNLR